MLFKVLFAMAATLAVLWGAGVDLRHLKSSVTHFADGHARTMTGGGGSDWGG